MKPIQMVDLGQQYKNIKREIDLGIANVIEDTSFIKGAAVSEFEADLGKYLNDSYVIGCGNGTDALQIALMALDIKPGDEVIVPSFTYVATAEVIALLKLVPVMVDVDPNLFTMRLDQLEDVVSPKTKAIIPVHLYGQMAPMEQIGQFAKKHNLYVIEDTAQGIGSYHLVNGEREMASTIGDIGCLSFFPSKNLGCYGDGGALVTRDKELAQRIRMVSNHGQAKKYYHDLIGVNSRLDSIQAAVLKVKLEHLDAYNKARNKVAAAYSEAFQEIEQINVPQVQEDSYHVFHQYTMILPNGGRDDFKQYLLEKGIPSMIYYPVPIHKQKAYSSLVKKPVPLDNTEWLTDRVISLPIHTEMGEDQLEYIISAVKAYFN